MNKLFLILFLISSSLSAQTISEKKAEVSQGAGGLNQDLDKELSAVNSEAQEIRGEIASLQLQARELATSGAEPSSFAPLAKKVGELRARLRKLQQEWRERASAKDEGEQYALWYQPETTVEQLVMDYGSQDQVYLIPPDIALMKLTIASNFAVPRDSWTEMLEWILGQSGVGIKQVNPYLRSLYSMQSEPGQLASITSSRDDLQLHSEADRLCYVVEGDAANMPALYAMLEKFVNPERVRLNLFGGRLFMVGRVSDLQETLRIHDFLLSHGGPREYRLVSLSKISGDEMRQLLGAIFQDQAESGNEKKSEGGLLILPLKQLPMSLFLLGSSREVERAEGVIEELEAQLGEAQDQSIFRYRCKHTEAEELAQVLEKVYALIVSRNLEEDTSKEASQTGQPSKSPASNETKKNNSDPYNEGISIVVKPQSVDPSRPEEKKTDSNRRNFIVDEKTGTIIMVVEPFALDRLKALIRKLDVPKKMVRIEVLLFEKGHSEQNNFGLNLLRIGDTADQTKFHGGSWNDIAGGTANKGILSYMLSRPAEGMIPSFDLSYRLLLGQKNVTINASPSVVTVNQTKAVIKLVEEISLNTGVVELDTASGTSNLKDSFVRAQYGITIEVTPTIHLADDEDDDGRFKDYITLETDITFDSAQPSVDARPNVTRRNISNQVRIADGETVILGGLRQKRSNDDKDSIPFLGEVPGFGKLFSNRTSSEETTELFIMLTPTIVSDPLADFARIREEEMKKRPGDLPEFLERLVESRDRERERLFRQSLDLLLSEESKAQQKGRPREYDGRG